MCDAGSRTLLFPVRRMLLYIESVYREVFFNIALPKRLTRSGIVFKKCGGSLLFIQLRMNLNKAGT
jgi:hypothetical protein